jgi:hypothetical protein
MWPWTSKRPIKKQKEKRRKTYSKYGRITRMNKIAEALHEEDLKKGWTPKVITGGKGPPDFPGDPNDPDWLTPLKDGTVFLVEHKKSTDVFALQVQIISHGLRCVLISMAGHQKPEWTIPLRFCRDFRYIETIMTAEEFEIELKAREQIEASNVLGMKED